MTEPIRFWNRESQTEETELVFGEFAVRWLYQTRPGQWLVDHLLSKRWISVIYGAFQSSSLSRGKIGPFIKKFKIPMKEYEDVHFQTFNDFFIRKFRPRVRPFAQDPDRMPAFSEARYLAFEKIEAEQLFPVKGKYLTAQALLGNAELAAPFLGGPLLLARLCPVDYHRFHFPDAGKIVKTWRLHGALHSVNPLALNYRGDIFATNERQVSILETQNFGRLAYIEVGALCVGKIVQSWKAKNFERGQEKGYFLFGGSTVIVLGEPGKWAPDPDLLEQTRRKRETLVKLGVSLAKSL